MGASISIAIPTFRRPQALARLLASVKAQVDANPELEKNLRVHVYDNDSQDSTPEVAAAAGLGELLRYSKNDRNIGGDNNIYKSYTDTPGDYIWVVGDDDLLLPGGIMVVRSIIEKLAPSLIVNKDRAHYFRSYAGQMLFADVKEFMRVMMAQCPGLLAAQGLISRNVIKAGTFERELAREMLAKSCYAHMYGLFGGALADGGGVAITEKAVLAWGYAGLPEGGTESPEDAFKRGDMDDLARSKLYLGQLDAFCSYILPACGLKTRSYKSIVRYDAFKFAFMDDPNVLRRFYRILLSPYHFAMRNSISFARFADAVKSIVGYGRRWGVRIIPEGRA